MQLVDRRQWSVGYLVLAVGLGALLAAAPVEARNRGADGDGAHASAPEAAANPTVLNGEGTAEAAAQASDNAADAMAAAAAKAATAAAETPLKPDGEPEGASAGAAAAGEPSAEGAKSAETAPAAAGPSEMMRQAATGPSKVNQTAYSHKGSASRPAAVIATGAPAPEWMVVHCHAGCASAPGETLLDVPVDPAIQVYRQSPEDQKAASDTSTIVCMGGCYDAPKRIAGLPGTLIATDPGVVVTSGKPTDIKKQGSGAWMVRINRERDATAGEAAPAQPASKD